MKSNPVSSHTADRVAGYILLTLLTLLLILTAVYSLEWHIGHDPAWLLYEGRLIDQHHLAPYRDFHDVNFPGSLYFYLLVGKVIGFTNEQLLRVIDLGYLGAIGLATWLWLRPLGRMVAWGATALFGIAYLTSDITVNFQRDYIIILPITCAALLSTRFSHWPPAIRSLLVGVLGGLAATIKPHALIGWPVIFGFMYFDSQRTQPRQPIAQLVRLGLPGLVGLLIPIGTMFLYLLASGVLSNFIEIETQYVPLYSHVILTPTTIDYSDRFGHILRSYTALNGFGWWLIPAGVGIALVLRANQPESRHRRLVFQMIGLAICYSLYPVVSGQFYNYHWLPFLYCLMTLSALSLTGLPKTYPAAIRWLPILALAGGLVLPPSQIPDALHGVYRRYVQGQPIPPNDGGVADELATYLLTHYQPGDRVQVLGSGGPSMNSLLLADVIPATSFLSDIYFYHDLSHPLIQRYRQTFMSQLDQSQPRFVVDMYLRHFFIGPDSSIEFPEFSEWLARNYQLAYVSKTFAIYEYLPEHNRGFVVYPLHETNIPIRYHPEAAADVMPVSPDQTSDPHVLNERLSGFIDRYDIVQVEFLSEQDPTRVIESWLGQHAFRIGEHWINATRIVEYLVVAPECLDMQTSDVTFGSSMRLEQSVVALIEKGETKWVCIRLDWSAIHPMNDSYKFSVRVVVPDGQVIAAYDSQPAGYLEPTTGWKPGEAIHDQLAIQLPDTLTVDCYRVELVVYNEMTMEHLSITDSAFPGDTFLLRELVPNK
ncbi:MAG: hypothetical protein JXB07_10875 [Anaerolineae bacterium]|nr:hypothetical protein [Anaerolineae bacterium]